MIVLLDHHNLEVANNMREVFQASYAIEAELLQAENFPPLQRTVTQFMQSDTQFYGYFIANVLTACIELRILETQVHLQSLVVHPTYFRQGIGSKMMEFVLSQFHTLSLMVETGVDNTPAISLYKKFGFVEVKRWMTSHHIHKTRMVRICS